MEVAGGDYASASEIVREALRDWEVKKEVCRRMEALRADFAAGIESGPAIPGEEVIERLLQRYPAQP